MEERDDLAVLIERVLDSETGILKFVSMAEIQADEPPLYVGMAEMMDSRKVAPRRLSASEWQKKSKLIANDSSEHLNAPSGTIHSSGAGIDRTTALWATVGEACERYAMNYYHPEDSILANVAELSGDYLDPTELILFDDKQYKRPKFAFVKFDPESKRHWIRAVSMLTSKKKFLPAELCVGTVIPGGSRQLDGAYSTGCAAGPNYQQALLSGLSEVVERDAFMYYWMTRQTPQKLDLKVLSEQLPENLIRLINYPHVEVFLRWLETDIDIPTVACFIKPRYARGFATGASTNVDWRVAVEKAVVESFHTLNWTVDLDRWSDEPRTQDNITDFPHHVQYYLEAENHHNIEFLISHDGDDGTEMFLDRYDERVLSYKDALAKVEARGYEPLAVDRTYDDLDSLSLKVVHVVIPGLHPLHVGLGIEHRDTRRLGRIADYFNTSMPDKLNLNPHPFP